MKIALFIPCFIDAYFPEVGIATLELLERLDCDVDYPLTQTCCGQPMSNSGCQRDAAGCEALFVRNFSGYDHIVAPSASCVHHVREHLDAIGQTDEVLQVRRNTYELVDFLHDVLQVKAFPWAAFPHKVGLHNSCTALRSLGHASVSEIDEPPFSKPMALLSAVKDIQFTHPRRPDECCGFGGTFAIKNAETSTAMMADKIRHILNSGAEICTAGDNSCLMHIGGGLARLRAGVRTVHLAEILAATESAG